LLSAGYWLLESLTCWRYTSGAPVPRRI